MFQEAALQVLLSPIYRLDFQGEPWPFSSSSFSHFSWWLLSNIPKECKKELKESHLKLGKGSQKQWLMAIWKSNCLLPLLSPELHNQEWLCLVSHLLSIIASLHAFKCGNMTVIKRHVHVNILHGMLLLQTVFKYYVIISGLSLCFAN